MVLFSYMQTPHKQSSHKAHPILITGFVILVLITGYLFYVFMYPKTQVIPEVPYRNTASGDVDTIVKPSDTVTKPIPSTPTEPVQTPVETPVEQPDVGSQTSQTLPKQVNLKVPFTSQAPFKVWDAEHDEFCEEASVVMAASYVQGKPIKDAQDADNQMFAIQDFEMKRFGAFEDTDAEQTKIILTEFLGIEKVAIKKNPTIDDIKAAVAAGKVVIVPAAGRQLPNPNFQSPGPIYHMFVVKGYNTKGQFITNDPGTRKGADFLYKFDDLMNAIHDWNNGDVYNGQKVILIVG